MQGSYSLQLMKTALDLFLYARVAYQLSVIKYWVSTCQSKWFILCSFFSTFLLLLPPSSLCLSLFLNGWYLVFFCRRNTRDITVRYRQFNRVLGISIFLGLVTYNTHIEGTTIYFVRIRTATTCVVSLYLYRKTKINCTAHFRIYSCDISFLVLILLKRD